MKKNLILVAMASMMMASCVQEESLENQDVLSSAPKEITFQTVVAKQKSRALIQGTEYKSTYPAFGSWARYNPNGLTVGYMQFITNDEIEYKHDGNVEYWGPKDDEHKHYWPSTGSLTFFSYSPFYYQEGNKDQLVVPTNLVNSYAPVNDQHGIKFPDYDVAAHQLTDLMVADVQVGQTANITANEGGNYSAYTGVPTIFRHKLAVIGGFRLSTSDDYDGNFVPGASGVSGHYNQGAETGDMRFFIKKIELVNIKTKGTYWGATVKADGTQVVDKWDSQNTPDSFTWFESTEGVEFGYGGAKELNIAYTPDNSGCKYESPTVANDYLLVLPQEFQNIDFVNGETTAQYLKVTYIQKTYTAPSNPDDNLDYTTAENCWKSDGVDKVKKILLYNVHPEGKKAWSMNQMITYNLKFSTDEIRWAPHIEVWEEAFRGGYVVDF